MDLNGLILLANPIGQLGIENPDPSKRPSWWTREESLKAAEIIAAAHGMILVPSKIKHATDGKG